MALTAMDRWWEAFCGPDGSSLEPRSPPSGANMRVPGAEQTHVAGRLVFDAGLERDGSAFTPGRAIWTAAVADDLHHRFVEAPELGADRFVDKLRRQLAGAPHETLQFAAEVVYLYLLSPNEVSGATKRRLLDSVLAIGSERVPLLPELDAALDGGFARAGTAYQTQRDRQIAWLVRLIQAWKGLPPDRQREALDDPWVFRDAADAVPIGSAYSQRNALLHLAFPDTFESIVSRRHKKAIVAAFADDVLDPTGDEDRALLALRGELERQTGGPITFYQGDLERRWRGSEPELRGWLVRGANVHGKNLVPTWLAVGYCSLAYPGLGPLDPGLSRPQIDVRLAEELPDLSVRQRSIHVGVLDRFLNQMQPVM